MDAEAKKTALRMIPYGLYIMTAKGKDGGVAAATVNWATQASFAPPIVAVGVKVGSGIYAVAKEAGAFALNMLGKGQQGPAFAFFKPAQLEGDKISGQPFRDGSTGAPILTALPAAVECKLLEIVERGDHHIFVAEVVDAHVMQAPTGRPDMAILEMKELGEKVFYGG
jgi:flavin reductase (DIM6/NTAB) family NADH-FMN oxidoreductase RutF